MNPEERKAGRRRTALVVAAIVALIPTLAIFIVNHIQSEVPPPLWTPEALPEPPEAENGWALIRHYHATTISGIDLEPLDKLMALARDGKPLGELGGVLAPARVVASKIGEHTQLCSEAFAKEHMVIGCLSLEPGACKTEALDICARIVTFAAIDEAARGSAHGVERMSHVLRQLTDASANSRHLWVQARALLLLRRAIHDASVILKWRRTPNAPLRDAIAKISDDSLPVLHMVIATYLLKHLALDEALDKTDTWLLDEGDLLSGLNAPFEVAKRGGELPPPPDFTAGLFWWFDNPVGKRMLDAVRPGADEDFVRTLELRATVLERRDEALQLE